MPEVGVRELKARASEILREVHDRRVRYTITYRGRPIGVLLPVPEVPSEGYRGEDPWEELTHLGEDISRNWQSPLSSMELLTEMRR